MATTRIMPLHIGKGRTESRAISAIIDYVANPQKTDHGRLITGYECDSRVADAEFMLAKLQYIAATGRVRGADDVIAYHVRQSFCPGEITPEEANRLGVEFAKRFTKGKHAFIVCTHIDKAHVHNHIIWSSVNLDCDRKFRNFWGSTKAVRRLSDTLCIENGLSIVENPQPHGKSYDQWLGDQAKPSHRELLRSAIDNALAQKPADLDELLKLLRESGCEVSKRGKSYRLKLPGWGKVSRLDSLGDGYTLEDLLAVLAGHKAHTPRQKPVKQADPPKVNLLVDIQAKLQAGKGAGYVRWAKVFNLKQMAQTVNYLTEQMEQRPSSEWIRVPDAHEPLIAKQDFELVQRIRRLDTRTSPKQDTVYLFSGVLICGCCGSRMTRKTNRVKGKEYHYYYCPTGKKHGCTNPVMLKESDLVECVKDSLKGYIDNVSCLQAILDGIDQGSINQALANEYASHIAANEQQVEQALEFKARLYESLITGTISKEEYTDYKARYTRIAEKAKESIRVLKEKLADVLENRSERNRWISHFTQFSTMETLDRKAVVHMIQSIKVIGKKELEITFTYQDEYQKAIQLIQRAEKTSQRKVG